MDICKHTHCSHGHAHLCTQRDPPGSFLDAHTGARLHGQMQMWIDTCVQVPSHRHKHKCTHAYMHKTCGFLPTWVCRPTHEYSHTWADRHECAHVHTQAHTYTWANVNMCVHMCICLHTRAQAYRTQSMTHTIALDHVWNTRSQTVNDTHTIALDHVRVCAVTDIHSTNLYMNLHRHGQALHEARLTHLWTAGTHMCQGPRGLCLCNLLQDFLPQALLTHQRASSDGFRLDPDRGKGSRQVYRAESFLRLLLQTAKGSGERWPGAECPLLI